MISFFNGGRLRFIYQPQGLILSPEEGIMNCDYCGSEVETSEVTMTDMGDQVCTPCLIGKPAEIVTLDFIPTK
jgi:hypothetical protein